MLLRFATAAAVSRAGISACLMALAVILAGTAADSFGREQHAVAFGTTMPVLPAAVERPHLLFQLNADAPVAVLSRLHAAGLKVSPAGAPGVWYAAGGRSALQRLLQDKAVQGVALPSPAFKQAAALQRISRRGGTALQVLVLFHSDVTETEARAAVGRVVPLATLDYLPGFAHGTVTLPAAALDRLAAEDAVFQLWPAPPPRHLENINSRDSINVEKVEADLMWLDGQGVRLGIWDGGRVRETHLDFGGRVTSMDGSPPINFHATHVAGTMAGSGAGSNTHSSLNLTRGMAPGAEVWSFNYSGDLAEMDDHAPLLDASNHSYGYITGWRYSYAGSGKWHWFASDSTAELDEAFGKYDPSARDFDQVVYDHLLPVFKSAGNDRNDSGAASGGDHYHGTNSNAIKTDYHRPDGFEIGFDTMSYFALAKNIISVGSVHDVLVDPSGAGSINMTAYSGWGPADDGRIKPDLVANGESVYSTGDRSDTDAFNLTGTSMASPAAAGAGALLVHRASVSPRTAIPLRAAEMKALLIHTAVDAGLAGPDYRYGWGLIHALDAVELVEAALLPGAAVVHGHLSAGAPAQSWSVHAGSSGPIKATLVWVDPPGAPNTGGDDDPTRALVHDLDLLLTSPTGISRYPWTLDRLSPLTAAVRDQANQVDNVEQVLVDTTDMEEGTWSVQVAASAALGPAGQSYFLVLTFACGGGDSDCDGCLDDALLDADDDGVCADRDNCADVWNPLQRDGNGSGAGDACDATDGVIQGVAFSAADGTMIWDAEEGAESYNVYRRSLTTLQAGDAGDCYLSGLEGPQATISDGPAAAGEVWLLQVTGSFSSGEGGMGTGRNGQERLPASACP